MLSISSGLVTLVAAVGSFMAQQGIHGLTLPEICADSREKFDRSWKRFEVICAANKWEGGKDLTILPALLQGKLLDIYTSLSDVEKADLATLKKALADRAGLTKDPYAAAKRFAERGQEMRESVRDFEMALRKLFEEAYPSDEVKTSSVFLGRFVTGLRPEIVRQVLLCGIPDNLEDAIKHAIRVERALVFDEEQRVQAVQAAGSRDDTREVLDKLVSRMEALELRLQERKSVTGKRPPDLRCYFCDQAGHIKRYCPLRRSQQTLEVCYCNSTSLRVRGRLGGQNVSFLVDSGAAVSVVSYDVLSPSARADIKKTAPLTIGANGLPLDVLGTIDIMIDVETVNVQHDFVVARKLTVDCLLGMDFLSRYGAIIDCSECKLTLLTKQQQRATQDGGKVARERREAGEAVAVNLTQLVKIPARSQVLVWGKVCCSTGGMKGEEGLIEPINNQRGVLIARSLCTIRDSNEIPLQIVNVGHTEMTLYEGTKLAEFSVGHAIMTLEDNSVATPHNCEMPDVDLTGADLSEAETEKLKQLIWEFRSIFAAEGSPPGRTGVVKHHIRVKGPPVREPLRRIPYSLQETVSKEVKKMLQQGVIRESKSPWSSPVVMVKKKDGSWRFCIDFRKLNDSTERDAYPLPRIDATLESLAGSQFFSTLDLASGYWQVEVEESDREKTAFSTREGHFEFNVMPFGLTNAPPTFQRLMECVLAGLTYEQCLIYLDDIIVFSVSFEQHLERLKTVFQHVLKAGLKLKGKKCHFAKSEIRYLGHIVSRKGIQADPEKLRAVQEYPVPRNVTALRQFLGLTNYYRRFVQGYSSIAAPLHKLTAQSAGGYKWDKNCQATFEDLKQRLISPPILAYPDFQYPFTVATDASGLALGAVLSQEVEGVERVVAFWSRQLNKAERNYSTIEREALAVVAGIKEFFPYLYGRPFTVYTDHNPLTSLRGLKDTGGRLTRWLLYLQQFDLTVKYRAGKLNGNADGMSRRQCDTLESPTTIAQTVMGVTTHLGDPDLLKCEQNEDPFTKNILLSIKDGKWLPPETERWSKYVVIDGILCRQNRNSQNPRTQVVIPKGLRSYIFEELHIKSGHQGVHKTLEKVKERFFWPGYEQEIRDAVQRCDICQRRNHPVPAPQAPLGTISSNYPFQKISWDIMGPLPVTARGFKYILVITDLFSKWVEAFPLVATDSNTLAKVLVDEIVCRYGMSITIHSDQGSNFVGTVIRSLCAMMGIQRTQTTAYHPQGNGQVERFNRTLEQMLSKVVSDHQRDWDEHLQKVLFAYRTAIHDSTGYSPFLVTFGRSPNLPVDIILGRPSPLSVDVPQFVQKTQTLLQSAFSQVHQNLQQAHHRQKQGADKGIAGEHLQVGDRVWLFVPAVKQGQCKKFTSRWKGPYTVINKTSPVNYRIQLIGGNQQLTVHRNRLKLCYTIPAPDGTSSKEQPPNETR